MTSKSLKNRTHFVCVSLFTMMGVRLWIWYGGITLVYLHGHFTHDPLRKKVPYKSQLGDEDQVFREIDYFTRRAKIAGQQTVIMTG